MVPFGQDVAFNLIDAAAAKHGAHGIVLVVNHDDNQQAKAWAWARSLVTPAGNSALFRSDEGPTRAESFEEYVRSTAVNFVSTEYGGAHSGRQTRLPAELTIESVTVLDERRARIGVAGYGQRGEFTTEFSTFSGFSLLSAARDLLQRSRQANLAAVALAAGVSSEVHIITHGDMEVHSVEVRGTGVVVIDPKDHAGQDGEIIAAHALVLACAVAHHLPQGKQVTLVAPTPSVAFLECANLATRLYVAADHPQFPACVRHACEAFDKVAEWGEQARAEWLRHVTNRSRQVAFAPASPVFPY